VNDLRNGWGKTMSLPRNVHDMACFRAKIMSLPRNVHDLGVNVHKTHET
jgi:hypothetical protein